MKIGEQIGVVVLLAGALRIGYAQVVHPPADLETHGRIDARYAGLAALLPVDRPVAWLSENGLETLEGQRRFGEASYALSPRILLPDDGSAALVLIDLASPEKLAELARRENLQLLRTVPGGASLLSRKTKNTE